MAGPSPREHLRHALPPAELEGSPAFGLDEQQRILFWSQAAEDQTHMPAAEVVGRPCYEVVQGRDFFGHPFCRQGCPAFSSVLNGHLQSFCALEVGGAEQHGHRVRWRLLALPPGSHPRVVAFSGHRASELLRLAQLGLVNLSLSAPMQLEALHDVLGWIGDSTDMEVAELFLLDRQTHQMVLTAQRGPFSSAFRQITQFSPGEGYPGLVAARGEPIITNDLPHDPRYLRTRVKESGFTEYICVPLVGPEGVQGTLNVASRRRRDDLAATLRLLHGLSRPLSAALALTILRAQDSVADFQAEPVADLQRNLELLLQQVILKFLAVSGARGGAVVLWDGATGSATCRVAEGEADSLPFCPLPAEARVPCPAWAQAQNVVLLGHRSTWPEVCRAASGKSAPTLCLPLVAAGRALGVVSLQHRPGVPLPPTRYLAVLSAMAHRAALLIKNLQTYQKAWDVTVAAERERLFHALRMDPARPWSEPQLLPEDGPGPVSRVEGAAFLDLHCFGDFAVYRNGRLLSAQAFPRRQALTALKVLIASAGRKVPKDVLIEYLWPDAEPESAADRLFVVIHALRGVLEPGQGPPWRFVRTDGDSYYWNTDAPYRLDVDEFRKGIRRGEELERQGQVAQALAVYQATAQLYRGDFLQDEPYSDWCWTQREFFRELYLGLVRKVAHLLQQQGDLESAVLYYKQALQGDPLREEIQRELMGCLWRAGRRDEALRQYATFSRHLQKELEVEPLPETQELYHQMARQQTPDG